MRRVHIPERLVRNMHTSYGELGLIWTRALPAGIRRFADERGLELGARIAGPSLSYVSLVRLGDGREAVLKAALPSHELTRKAEALRAFAGRGVASLLDFDPTLGVLLLERLRPGAPLSGSRDEAQATSAVARLMRSLWREPPREHSFPGVSELATAFARIRERFFGGSGPLDATLFARAESLIRELTQDAPSAELLHGDLHHEHVLSAERSPWLAIDPRGVIGERAFEAAAWLQSPLPALLRQLHPHELLSRRLARLCAELDLDAHRVLGFAEATAVLSAIRCFEEHAAGWEPWLDCAQLLREVATSRAYAL